MTTTDLVIDLAQDNVVLSLNKHIVFFMEDQETRFETIRITTARDRTPITVYIKNISDFLLNNIELIIPKGITIIGKSTPPKELKPKAGFFLEMEVSTKRDSEKFIQVQSKPHSVTFE